MNNNNNNQRDYHKTVESGASVIVDAIISDARNQVALYIKHEHPVLPTYVFVGKLEYEALTTEIGVRVSQERENGDIRMNFTFSTMVKRELEYTYVTLIVRLVPDEHRLLKVA